MKQLLSATGLLCLLIAAISVLDSCKKQDDLFLDTLPIDSVQKTIIDTIDKQKRRIIDSILSLLPIIPTITPIPEPIPVGGSTTENPNDSTYCTIQKYKWAPGNEESLLLDPTADVIFPGSLLRAESITEGSYIPIVAPRRPILISTSLTNVKGSPKDTVLDPARKSSAQDALTRLFSRELDGNFTAKMTTNVERIYSKQQASIAVGANYGGYGATVSGNFNWSNTKIKQRYMVKFYQEFFSVSVDIPEKPSDMFSGMPNPKLIGSYSPVYVSNIKYGRVVLFLWETESDDTNIGAELHTSYSGFGQSGGLDVIANFKSLMQKATMKVFAVGGDAEEAAKVNSPETLKTFIEKGVNFKKAAQGVPIAYTLRFLKDNAIAKVVQSSEYTARNCEVITGQPFEFANAEPYDFGVDLVKGDGEFNGHGPIVHGEVNLFTVNDREVWMKVSVKMEETVSDWTTGVVNKDVKLFTIPEGNKIINIVSPKTSSVDYVDQNHDADIFQRGDNDLVKTYKINGDVYGTDLPSTGFGNRSYVRIYLNKVIISMRKKL